MTPHDIEIIRSGFKMLARDPDGFEAEFYAFLFKQAPHLRPLFEEGLQLESRKLVGMLAVAVNAADARGKINDILERLARRRTGQRIKPGHFAMVGEALLATLSRRLGAAFTDDVAEAWRNAYIDFSETMLAAVYNPIHLAA